MVSSYLARVEYRVIKDGMKHGGSQGSLSRKLGTLKCKGTHFSGLARKSHWLLGGLKCRSSTSSCSQEFNAHSIDSVTSQWTLKPKKSKKLKLNPVKVWDNASMSFASAWCYAFIFYQTKWGQSQGCKESMCLVWECWHHSSVRRMMMSWCVRPKIKSHFI